MTALFPSVTCDIDLGDVLDGVRRMDAAVVIRCQGAPAKAATEGLAESKQTKRYRDRTGKLSGKATAKPIAIRARGAESEIRWPVRYASYVDAGTAPHIIMAKRVPRLVFFWERMGFWFRGPKVKHPGTRPTGFAGVAYHKAERVLEREGELAARDAEQAFNR